MNTKCTLKAIRVMLRTYFFIPANNPRFIEKAEFVDATHLIYDLEDSVNSEYLDQALNNIATVKKKDEAYIRFRLHEENTNTLNSSLIRKLIEMGFKKFVLPKFSHIKVIEELEYLFRDIHDYAFNDFEFLLLIEDPGGLLHLRDTLEAMLINITGIGFGSHDYCNIMQVRHTMKNLYIPRTQILIAARAFGIVPVDIISMETQDKKRFKEEALDGFEMGFGGKFVLHPKQLRWLDEIQYYSDEEIEQAMGAYEKILTIREGSSAIVVIDGVVYEKPHIQRILKIVKWNKQRKVE
jgi:citrate lyase beta subunit